MCLKPYSVLLCFKLIECIILIVEAFFICVMIQIVQSSYEDIRGALQDPRPDLFRGTSINLPKCVLHSCTGFCMYSCVLVAVY